MRAAIVEARRINAGEMDPFASASSLRRASLTLPPMLAAADVAALAAAAGQRQSSNRRGMCTISLSIEISARLPMKSCSFSFSL
jgi:hypothetical protein